MATYLINFSICLFSLWVVYKLLLENTSWHLFKRLYLIGAAIISAIIPMIVVRTIEIPYQPSQSLVFTEIQDVAIDQTDSSLFMDWTNILLMIYLAGVFIMGWRFFKNLHELRIKPTDELENYDAYTLVLRKVITIPHSFLTRIYASCMDYKSGSIPESVLKHEKAHLDQKHSWDILMIEMLIVVMWFNPLIYLLKYAIKLNHEFLADRAVLATGVNTKTYQETLLAYSSSTQYQSIANTINFPIIKKRFTIMKTHTTTASGLLRSLALIPVLALLVISCGQEEVIIESAVTEKTEVKAITDHPEIIEVIAEDGSNHYTLNQRNSPGYLSMNGKSYSYIISSGKAFIFTLDGKPVDYRKEGYTIDVNQEPEIIEVEVDENSSEPSTLLEYIDQNKDNLLYYKDGKQITESEAINNIEVFGQSGVEIGRDKNGKKAIKITMNESRWRRMPPPPPPAPANSPTQAEQIASGDLRIYINDKIATQSQLDKLAGLKQSDWKNIAIYPKVENGVRTTYFYGEGL